MERFIHLKFWRVSIAGDVTERRALVLHAHAISASFFREENLARAEKMRRQAARTLTKSLRSTPNPSVLVCWDSSLANHPSPASSAIPLQHPVHPPHRLDKEWRTSGRPGWREGSQRALWELDLKALHFGGAAKRKHLSSASAPDCLCLALPRELLQPSSACENKPRSGEYYGDGNFLIVPTRVSIRSSEFPSLILSFAILSEYISRRCFPYTFTEFGSEYFVK